MSKSNGYLRQGEFRTWAGKVDQTLDKLANTVEEHGKQLAVFTDRAETTKGHKAALYQAISALIVAMLTAIATAWHIFGGVK